MANSDKNILITPNIGSASADPKIVFSGASASVGPQNITLQVYPTNSGTLSFEGSAGQLFSITNSMTGTIYSVNDVSGIPSIEVLDTGLIKLAQYSGNVVLGSGTDNGSKLQITGAVTVNGNTVLHAGNYNNYAPTLTGTGASGTWGISINGNAATASNGGVTSVNGQTGAVTITAGSGTVTGVTATAPVVSSGGTAPVISMGAASSGVNGYMTGAYATKLDGIASGATNVTNTNQLTNGSGYITSSGSAATFTSTTQNSQFNSIGIGVAGSGTTGEIRATSNITAYYSSDIKFKENVHEITGALNIVKAIGGKYFDWTDAYIAERGGADGYFIQKSDFGVIAQDVQRHFPRAVRTRPDGSLAVDYEKLSALAFAAINEQDKRIARLESTIEQLLNKE